jgi:hypothetical protein
MSWLGFLLRMTSLRNAAGWSWVTLGKEPPGRNMHTSTAKYINQYNSIGNRRDSTDNARNSMNGVAAIKKPEGRCSCAGQNNPRPSIAVMYWTD